MTTPSTHPFQRLDLSSPVPYYQQISELLRARIHSGEWPLGTRIPTESELCAAYEVSRVTVRQALALLVNDGMLSRGRGKGTFVREPPLTAGARSVASFTTELRALGMRAGSKLLLAQHVPAEAEIAAELDVAAGEPLLHLRRLRTADDRPIGIQDTFLVAARFDGLLELMNDNASLYEILRSYYGVVPSGATEVFHATSVSQANAALLDCRPGNTALHVVRVTFDDIGTFERTESVLHGERYQIRLTLRNPQPTKGSE